MPFAESTPETINDTLDRIVEEIDAAAVDGYRRGMADARVNVAINACDDLNDEDLRDVLSFTTIGRPVVTNFITYRELSHTVADVMGVDADDDIVAAYLTHSGWDLGLDRVIEEAVRDHVREFAYYEQEFGYLSELDDPWLEEDDDFAMVETSGSPVSREPLAEWEAEVRPSIDAMDDNPDQANADFDLDGWLSDMGFDPRGELLDQVVELPVV